MNALLGKHNSHMVHAGSCHLEKIAVIRAEYTPKFDRTLQVYHILDAK